MVNIRTFKLQNLKRLLKVLFDRHSLIKHQQSNLNVIPLVPSLKSEAIVIRVNSSLSKVPDGKVHPLHRMLLPMPVINVSELKEGEDAWLADNTEKPPESHR